MGCPQQLVHATNSHYNTNNYVSRDLHNHYYGIVHSPPPIQLPTSLFVIEALINLLSSNFTGRKEGLDYITKVFEINHGSAPTHCAVYAIPGMGKTQLALQYARLSYHQWQYSTIFWILGTTVEKLNQGFTNVLSLVDHPDHNNPDHSIRLTLAWCWLEESDGKAYIKWLLILDGMTQEAVGFLWKHLAHKNPMGNILLTTQTEAVTVTNMHGPTWTHSHVTQYHQHMIKKLHLIKETSPSIIEALCASPHRMIRSAARFSSYW
jgi:hypothetical protein